MLEGPSASIWKEGTSSGDVNRAGFYRPCFFYSYSLRGTGEIVSAGRRPKPATQASRMPIS